MIAAKGLLASAAFSSGAKFLSRLIGLVSTLILARILTPTDFAMIAIIAIVLHLFDILSHTGSEQYIVQKSEVLADDLNTAWTLDVVLKSLMCCVLMALAPFIADFFEQPHLRFAIQIASITLIINALKNPGLLLLKRALDYKSVFYLSLVQKIASFITVICIALVWQSYWAFVIADLVAAVVFTLGAYKIQPFRPAFSLLKVSEQWLFSKWLLGKSIIGYLRSQIDTVLVAKFFSPTQLGNYHMARDVAMLPGYNILGPAIEPLLADFKDHKQDPIKLGGRVSKVLCIVSLIVVPITTYMAFYPALIVDVLLGSQWVIAGEILGVMSLLFFYYCFLLVIESALTAVGKVKAIFMFDTASLLVIVVTLLAYLQMYDDLTNLLWLRVSIGVISTLVIGIGLHMIVPLKWMQIAGALILAVALSAIAITLIDWLTTQVELGKITLFLLSGVLFCGAYATMLIILVPRIMGTTVSKLLADYRQVKGAQ
ncbi:oligosaccharide flippase family protein [Paraglaciecola arctica]|uniref:oligosaccharide flippase family protein n=1 Tax=Paraglaciecola arctica TaxID=1128911 RepID=UPI001C071B43|nr:oligosaccharide flippase family protein [Paraglaciecola arctica]